jgi:hypothetical protein
MSRRHILPALLNGSVAGLLLVACSKSGEPKDSEKSTPEESRVKRGANGELIVVLDAETQQRIELKLENPAATQWQPEATGYGRALDPAPLAALLAELDSSRAAAEASRREYERLKVLAEQDNASMRALQNAEATAKRDQLLVESARARLALGWGAPLSERSDLAAFVRSLTVGEAALVRLDLPAGEALRSLPISARLISLSDPEHPVTAEFFDVATSVDAQTQGLGFLFLAKEKGLAPGTAVTGYLRIPGEPVTGVIIPPAAVLRHEGRAWVYVQAGENGFTRREITLDRPADNGWFLAGGVTATDRVVVSGAQTVLSEELNGGGFRTGTRE